MPDALHAEKQRDFEENKHLIVDLFSRSSAVALRL